MTNSLSTPAQDIALDTARILLKTRSVLLNPSEPFTLTSGRKSPVYVDCRRLISFPQERSRLMDYAAQIILEACDKPPELIAGGETAGIPYAAYISERLKCPMIYVRKSPKGFGRMAQIEGSLEKDNPRGVLVEDLQTDGGSKEVFVKAMRQAGIQVKHCFVIFHYGIFEKSQDNMRSLGIQLHFLTDWWHILKAAKKDSIFDIKDLQDVEAFLKDPENWSPGNLSSKSNEA